jgi:hypothetical protein
VETNHESFITSHLEAGSQGKNILPEETILNKVINNNKHFWKELMAYISLKYFNLYVKIINNNVTCIPTARKNSLNKPAEIHNQQLSRPISKERFGKNIPAATNAQATIG